MSMIILDETDYDSINSAVLYDAASSINFAVARLKEFDSALRSEGSLRVFDPATKSLLLLSSSDEFLEWIRKHFPVCLHNGQLRD